MRRHKVAPRLLAAAFVCILSLFMPGLFIPGVFLPGGLASAFAQSMLGQTPSLPPLAPVAVPPAPAMTAAPSAPAAPVAPSAAPPVGLVQTPTPPANPSSGQPANQDAPAGAAPNDASSAAPNSAPDTAPVITNTWVPAGSARLGVLDKVDGSTSQVSIPVGGQSQIGDLQISIQACDTRPPDQIPDTAIFLTVSPAGAAAGPPVFRGWMVRSVPAAAVVGDAGETFRVIGCG